MPAYNSIIKRYPWLQQWGISLLLAGLFVLAYSQSPLYTSNQNQYFLHGLARAGFGFLPEDWLANTIDPTPVFSLLVYLTVRYLKQPAIFYLYYGVLLTIYLFSLIGIARQYYPINSNGARKLFFVTLLILIHSAALRFTLSRAINDNWAYLLEDGLADQRLLGPVLQPSAFGVFLVWSIYLFLRGRPYLAVAAAVLAGTFHPTYLISAGCLSLAYMLVLYRQQRQWRSPVLLGLLALLLVSPIFYYVFNNFGGTSPAASFKAQEILVNFRIPHHAALTRWFDLTAAIKIGLIISALVLMRKKDLFTILAVPAAAGLGLTILQVLSNNDRLALLFPWRVSTFLVPVSITMLLAAGTTWLFQKQPALEGSRRKIAELICLAVLLLLAAAGVWRFNFEKQRQESASDRPLMEFVAANHQPGEVYLTPIEMQDFRLVTGSPAFVEFKSIPYRDFDVLEWYDRIKMTEHFYAKGGCSTLKKLAGYGVTHIVAGANQARIDCDNWQELYRDSSYRIYRIN